MTRTVLSISCAILVGIAALTGCATSKKSSAKITELEETLEAKDQEISNLESSLDDTKQTLSQRDAELQKKERDLREAEEQAKQMTSSTTSGQSTTSGYSTRSGQSITGSNALPAADVGECYAKVWVKPVYDSKTVKVLKKEASERIEVIPARYEWVDEQVLVKPASKKVVTVPASYETVEEKVLDTPAHTVWKKGRGAIEKIDNATGEIVCLIEVPASYKTVTKRLLKTSATTKELDVPAEYKTVRVRKLTEPDKVQRIPVEAQYETVATRTLVSEGTMEWRPVLCETNMSRDLISDLQRALDKAGHNPGPIDGIYGRLTSKAVRSYQKSKGLATGGLTLKTLESLGIRVGS